MGLIRKSLSVSTLGVVKGSSKKQRVAKATMKSSQATARATAATAAAVAQASRLAEAQASEEREFRYATDPAYRKFVDEKRAAEEAERRRHAEAVAEGIRLKKERSRARLRHVGTAIQFVGVAAAIGVVGVIVWLPQLAIARIRNRPCERWMQDHLRLTKSGS